MNKFQSRSFSIFLKYSNLSTFFKSLELILWAIVKIPSFWKELLRSRLSIMQKLDALTVILRVMLSRQLKSFLVDFLTLNISEWKLFKIPNFGKELLRSIQSITQSLDALTVQVHEIWTHKPKPDFSYFLTLSISKQNLVKSLNFFLWYLDQKKLCHKIFLSQFLYIVRIVA